MANERKGHPMPVTIGKRSSYICIDQVINIFIVPLVMIGLAFDEQIVVEEIPMESHDR